MDQLIWHVRREAPRRPSSWVMASSVSTCELQSTIEHLDECAAEGLRTLCVGTRDLTESEFASWFAKFKEAKELVVGREEAVMAVAEEIEVNLSLVGATAIEDKLQVTRDDSVDEG